MQDYRKQPPDKNLSFQRECVEPQVFSESDLVVSIMPFNPQFPRVGISYPPHSLPEPFPLDPGTPKAILFKTHNLTSSTTLGSTDLSCCTPPPWPTLMTSPWPQTWWEASVGIWSARAKQHLESWRESLWRKSCLWEQAVCGWKPVSDFTYQSDHLWIFSLWHIHTIYNLRKSLNDCFSHQMAQMERASVV